MLHLLLRTVKEGGRELGREVIGIGAGYAIDGRPACAIVLFSLLSLMLLLLTPIRLGPKAPVLPAA